MLCMIKKNDLVFSKQPSKITDKYNNKINVNSFTYDVIKKIIKADKIKIEDIENNKYFFENAIFDLNNNRIAGKDVEIKLDEKLFYPKNDPRFKGRSVIITEDSTEIENVSLLHARLEVMTNVHLGTLKLKK